MEFSRSLGAFVATVLRELQPTSRLAEFIESPPEHYTLRVEIPGEISKRLILARRLIEDALSRPAALRSLRLILRSEVLQPRSRKTVGDARATRAEVDTTVLGTCALCAGPVTLAERVVVRHAQVLHGRCWPARTA